MSETEYINGIVSKVSDNSLEAVKQILAEMGPSKYEYDDPVEELMERCHQEYVIQDGALYRIEEHNVNEDSEDIYNAHKVEGGKIAFEVRFYNGGCCLTEAVEEALSRLNKQVDRGNGPG